MHKRFLLLLLSLCAALGAHAQRKICFDNDWDFLLYESPDSLLSLPAEGWRTLSLPHDWSVEPEAAAMQDANAVGPFTQTSVGGDATGFTVGGEGWYRKRFTTPAEALTTLYFEGAYNETDVWINGQHAAFNPYGYSSFRVEATTLLKPVGEENELLVRVRNIGQNSRWYAGSGIYRHVWLLTTPAFHLDAWDTYVQASNSDTLRLTTTLHGQGQGKIEVKILDPNGKQVAGTKFKVNTVSGEEADTPLCMNLIVKNAARWSPDSPALYTAVLTLKGKDSQDEIRVPFGFRSIRVDADQGFLLNGQPTLLRGGCVHHDNGLLGAAAIDAAETRKLLLLKQNGFNAVRCSHNPPSEHFLHACDSLGLLVIDEAFDQWLRKKNTGDYHRYFPTWSDHDLRTLVRRDRNHPSVIMWSIGNEIPGRIEPEGIAAADRMRKTILALDSTRPITAALCSWDDLKHTWEDHSEKGFLSLDVGGYNYLYDKYEGDHAHYPARVMMGTESYPLQAAENWLLVEQHPYVIGDFVWTAMDYVGEAGIGSASFREKGGQTFFQKWPWMNGWCGDIDLIGQKKPQSYFRDVVWGISPVTICVEDPCPPGKHMAVSAWGWPLEHPWWTGQPGDTLTVNVYSRAPRVRISLNGKIIGEEATSATFKAPFRVPYESGVLRAEALGEGGAVEGVFELSTPGEPVALRLTADTLTIHADGKDLAYVTIELVDAEGRVCYDSSRQLRIRLSGEGTLLACGNASPNDMESFRSNTPRLFEGRALAIAQATGNPGNLTLHVETDGLPAQQITIESK